MIDTGVLDQEVETGAEWVRALGFIFQLGRSNSKHTTELIKALGLRYTGQGRNLFLAHCFLVRKHIITKVSVLTVIVAKRNTNSI